MRKTTVSKAEMFPEIASDDLEARKPYVRAGVSRLLADDGFCKALKALEDHLRSKVPEKLRGIVAALALLSIADGPQPWTWSPARAHETEDNWLETGKSLKALKAFPERIRRIAQEVEQVNRAPVFRPPSTFADLPTQMRAYADWLEGYAPAAADLTKQSFPTSQHGDPYPLQLSFLVRKFSDTHNDPEVADLLNAADRVHPNPEISEGDPRWHAQTFLGLRYRHKHNPSTT